jgi:hypothetical protein
LSRRNRPHAVGELNQRNDGRGNPDFGVIRLQKFQRGKRNNAIPNAAGANQQPPRYSITTGSFTSIVDGRKHISLLQAW